MEELLYTTYHNTKHKQAFINVLPKLHSRLREGSLAVGEVRASVTGHEPLLVGQANGLAGFVSVLHASLAVRRVRTRYRVDSLADDSLALNQLGLAVLAGLRRVESLRFGNVVWRITSTW